MILLFYIFSSFFFFFFWRERARWRACHSVLLITFFKFLMTELALGTIAWAVGDLGAQWWEFRQHKLERKDSRQVVDKRKDIDLKRISEVAAFGFLSAPLLAGYHRIVVPRVFGRLRGAPTPCLLALGVYQLIITPTLLLSFFGCMTAVRGGFTNTGFLEKHVSGGASKRFTVQTVQKYIFDNVLPFPLLSSWAVAAPLYGMTFFSPVGTLPKVATMVLTIWWCGVVSHLQSSLLL